MKKIRLHIIGTHGVPAKYGGFETLADHLCQNLNEEFEITVYCSSKKYDTQLESYFGAELRYIKLGASGFSGIIYDMITYIRSLFTADVILYLSPVGSGFITPLRIFSKTKVIVNHGGLNEWEREKLSWFQKRWAKFNHRIAANFSNMNIADNELYKVSLKENFGADSIVIRYGGNHVRVIDSKAFRQKYPFTSAKYAISVSRAQIDNNLHVLLEAWETGINLMLVLVSNWNVSDYGIELKMKYSGKKNITLLDAIYDIEELDFLRGNSLVYIHTHSRCGTAPSLVEAMSLGKAVYSYDVPTNRETTKNMAFYFKTPEDLRLHMANLQLEELHNNEASMLSIAQTEYSWKTIADQYKKVTNDLHKRT